MEIRAATPRDIPLIIAYDRWILKETLAAKIESGQVYVVFVGQSFAGWMRYGLFWDSIPFLNMIHLLPDFRNQGTGRAMMCFWEEEMRRMGYRAAMTSTSQAEQAQHFYCKLGYRAVGSFVPENEPLELLFSKQL